MQFNFEGIFVGIVAFFIIGLFHPIVIKCEYYFSERIWPVFLFMGLLFLIIALFIPGTLSIIFALVGITCLWSIGELKEQTNRVKKGWFPKNPKQKD